MQIQQNELLSVQEKIANIVDKLATVLPEKEERAKETPALHSVVTELCEYMCQPETKTVTNTRLGPWATVCC